MWGETVVKMRKIYKKEKVKTLENLSVAQSHKYVETRRETPEMIPLSGSDLQGFDQVANFPSYHHPLLPAHSTALFMHGSPYLRNQN